VNPQRFGFGGAPAAQQILQRLQQQQQGGQMPSRQTPMPPSLGQRIQLPQGPQGPPPQQLPPWLADAMPPVGKSPLQEAISMSTMQDMNAGNPFRGRQMGRSTEEPMDAESMGEGFNPEVVDVNDSYDVQRGDTLWDIAKRLYGDGSMWKRIYELNQREIGPNPNLIRPGLKLRVG
jgi:nucleoid-associated protein YgaU